MRLSIQTVQRWVLIVAPGIVACATSAPEHTKPAQSPRVVSAFNDNFEDRSVVVAGRFYLAIKAVEVYRRDVQGGDLWESELEAANFNIRVEPGSKPDWMHSTLEVGDMLQVSFVPKVAPGESYTFHGPRSLGRVAVYLVRWSDYKIVEAAFEPSP